MDKKLLDSLNNLSLALASIADALSSKQEGSATSEALKGGNLVEQIKSIDLGVKQLQLDTKEILKNQQTILNISRGKSSDDKTKILEQSTGKNKEKVKDGLATILLIATGVLALGLAFHVIGKVNFVSVMALSLALPLLAYSFEKISDSKNLTPGNMKNILLVVIGMSMAIAASSWILQTVIPIGASQLLTTVLIAGAFAALSFNIDKMTEGIKNVNPKDVWKLPIVLVAASLAIALSSHILQYVKPVGFFQLVTVVFISIAFAALSFSIGKMAEGIKKVDPKEMWKLPIVLIAASIAITASSWILQGVKPVGFFQMVTAIFISAAFVVISYGLPMLSKAMEKINVSKILLMPIVLVALSAAIVGSSMLLQNVVTIPIFTLLNIVFQAVTLAIIGVTLGLAMMVLSKVSPLDVAKGCLSLLLIAGTIAVSSQILSLGDYTKYPSLEWATGTGLSLLAFGLAAVGLGAVVMSGIGGLALLAGAGAILGIAGTIVLTAAILSKGSFANYPSLSWSTSTALSMAAFGAGMLLTGTFIVGSLGLGGLVLTAGASAMTTIAQSIVDVAEILSKGKFSGGPTKQWAEGVGLSIAAFAPVFQALSIGGVLKLFGGGGPSPSDMKNAIITISDGIIAASTKFAGVTFTGGPTKQWAEGVGLAISAFSPVYASLGDGILSMFGGGSKVDSMKSAIMGISQGIVDAANFFSKNKSSFDVTKVPSKVWGESVGGAISAFSPVFKFLSENSGIFGADIEDLNDGIISICDSIVRVSNTLAEGNFTTKLPPNFMSSISGNIKAYVDLLGYLDKKGIGGGSIFKVLSISVGINKLAEGYNKLSLGVKSLSSSLNGLDVEKLSALKSLTGSIVLMSLMDSEQFEKMMDALEDKAQIFVDVINELEGTTSKGSRPSISSVKTGSSKGSSSEKSMTDVYNMLSAMNVKLTSIDKSSKNLSGILDEIRTSDTNLKKKKF